MNSSPMKTNQEPGVNGVTSAKRPARMSAIPIPFFTFGFLKNSFTEFDSGDPEQDDSQRDRRDAK